MGTPGSHYPTTFAGRQQPADELTARGLKPTQGKQHFDRDRIDAMVEAMRDGSFAWAVASLQPVILGPGGEVLGGHHRVVAAHLAGVDLEKIRGAGVQVRRGQHSYRPVEEWADVLPDVP